jgi:uncharacterized secreted protein with C-terminal beta-propeller domain
MSSTNRKRSNIIKISLTALAAVSTFTVLSLTGVFGSKNQNVEAPSSLQIDVSIQQQLPKIKSLKNFKSLLKSAGYLNNYWMNRGVVYEAVESAPQGAEKPSTSTNSSSDNYSKTNVQVEGVDEGDIVKTDGEYIYKLRQNAENSSGAVDILKAYPAEAASKVSTYSINGRPSDLYINGDYLIIISDILNNSDSKLFTEDRYYFERNAVSILVLSIKDKSRPQLLKEVSVDGAMLTSRLVEDKLYVITNKYVYPESLEDKKNKNQVLPSFIDSATGEERKSLYLDDIAYCPEAIAPNYIIISSINLKELKEEIKVTAYLAQSNQVYCSSQNLYISGYDMDRKKSIIRSLFELSSSEYQEIQTAVYKFNLKDGEAIFQTSAFIPGTIINQFSMDENNDEFRIATTRDYLKDNKKYITDNNLYILDKDMKLKGKLENIAEGEKIYSTRFIGSRAYMVTFRTVDPLFVIDVSDGNKPKILGELKIPGFSNYLHPYDENHIIGFGLDTEVIGAGSDSERAMAKGMKMAIFDVTDVSNPKQKFETVIGDRGTYSDVLTNHKALLFDREKELLAIPVQVIEQNENTGQTNELFQGAYIYNVNLKDGFTLREKISHTEKDSSNLEGYNYNWNNCIQRILFIQDYLYSISNNRVMIHKIEDLKMLGDLKY